MLFQKKGPLIHKVYFEQIDVVHTFLIYFVKPENVVGVTFGKKTKGLEITKSDILPNKMFFGTGVRKIISLPLLIQLLEENEIEMYDAQVRKIMIDSTVKLPGDSDGNEVKCLNWWIQVSSSYPIIFKLVTGILSISHGPQVESTFSKMDHVLDDKSGNTDV